MPVDANERTYEELVGWYTVHFGRTDAPLKMAADLCAYERELMGAEAEISRLRAVILDLASAGYIRRDISSHYAPDWRPKKPLADAVDDEWIATGREAA